MSRQPQYKKDNSKFIKPNNISNKQTQKPTAEPMEVESTRSRLTINKNFINNHETNHSESESDGEDENPSEFDVNFQQASNTISPE